MKLPRCLRPKATGTPQARSLFRRKRQPAAAERDVQLVQQAEEAAPQAPAEDAPVVPRLQLAALSQAATGGPGPDEGTGTDGAEVFAPTVLAAAEAVAEDSDADSDSDSEVESPAPCDTVMRSISERVAALLQAAQASKAHRSNCLALAAFGSSMLETLEAGASLLPAGGLERLEGLAPLLGNAATLVTSCSTPGWLLLAASPDSCTVDAMQLVHAKMMDVLKAEGLDCLHGLQRLPLLDLHDCSRALHRRLRQLGWGSLLAGFTQLVASDDELNNLAASLGVTTQDVAQDAAHILGNHTLEMGLPSETEEGATDTTTGTEADAALAASHLALKAAFTAYATLGLRGEAACNREVEIDSFRCSKLCREAGLLGVGLTSQELDVMFAGAKERGCRRLTFPTFLRLLALVAAKRGQPLGEVLAAVAGLQRPLLRATTPEAVRFHDDRAAYTGVYARGGMSVIDDRNDLGHMVDRSAADKASHRRASTGAAMTPPLSRQPSGTFALTPRFTPTLAPTKTPGTGASGCGTPRLGGMAAARGAPAGRALTPRTNALTPRLTPRGATPAKEEESAEQSNLRLKFQMFAAFGRPSGAAAGEPLLDSAQFLKLLRDARLLSKQLDSTTSSSAAQ